ncbi:MAG: DUF2608 domain-containing protein [Acidobacteria bacterium]|nr:DUF2608 domain-containing protein [Acidobacteriota bacterium]
MFLAFCLLSLIHDHGPAPITSDTMQVVLEKAQEKSALYGSGQVLVVFDIDNTLLAMDKDFGSDQWFNWQYLLLHEPTNPDVHMANSMEELLVLQRELFALSKMHPPESTTPELVAQLQAAGHPVFALTSRGPGARNSTEREIAKNKYNLKTTAIGSSIAESFNLADEEGLKIFTPEQIVEYKLNKPRPVSYASGILMSEGQHKGAMLLLILQRFGLHYKAVIMVDDHPQHCARVATALQNRFNTNDRSDDDVDITTIHYTRELPRVEAFNKSDKSETLAAWEAFVAFKRHL